MSLTRVWFTGCPFVSLFCPLVCVCVWLMSNVGVYSMLVLSRSVVYDSRHPNGLYQAPLSMGFSRQEYWSGLPFPLPGDLPNPGMEPMCLVSAALAGGFFTSEPPGKPEHVT